MAVPVPSPLKDIGHSSMLLHCRKVISAVNRVKNLGEEGYPSLGKMLQGPVRDTVWSGSLAELKAPDGFQNLVRVCLIVFVNHESTCRDRRNGHRLKLSLQIVGYGFGTLRIL